MKSLPLTLLAIIAVTLSSCAYTFPDETIQEDNLEGVDFTGFYVIGGTYSSGLMNGVLNNKAQENAYPAIIGRKINNIYGFSAYQQFDINSDLGYNPFESYSDQPFGEYQLKYKDVNDSYPGRFKLSGESLKDWNGSIDDITDFSLPGLKIYEVDDRNYLNQNIYFNRITLQTTELTLLDLIIQNDPKIVVLNFGIDELLDSALTGGTLNCNSSDPACTILSDHDFQNNLIQVIERLTEESDAELFLVNVPDFIQSPYFSTLNNFFRLGIDISPFDIGQFISHYREFNEKVFNYNFIENGGVPPELRRPIIDFDIDGGDRFRAKVIYDETLPEVVLPDGTELPKFRQLLDGEYLLYSAESNINDSIDFGSFDPIPDEYTLRSDQIEMYKEKIKAYNNIIDAVRESYSNVHIIDINKITGHINNSLYTEEGVIFNSNFERHSIYSSDGFTLNPKGHALMANLIIDKLNEVLNVNFIRVDIHNFTGLNIGNKF